MCNCGSKRVAYTQQYPASTHSGLIKPETNTGDINFEYNGKTALSVVGNFTGKNYRFNHPGAVQTIDARDAAGMTLVPVLRRIPAYVQGAGSA